MKLSELIRLLTSYQAANPSADPVVAINQFLTLEEIDPQNIHLTEVSEWNNHQLFQANNPGVETVLCLNNG